MHHEGTTDTMAKKAELLAQATELGLDVTDSNTIKEIEAAIETATPTQQGDTDGTTEETHTDQNEADQEEQVTEPTTAKAGKRSAKALAEAEEKEAKEQRKTSDAEDDKLTGPKHVQKTRSKLERSGKKYRDAAGKVEKSKEHSVKQALDIACQTSPVAFDATVELHIRLNVDPKQADQNIRENIVLPAGTGKSVRVAVFGEPDDAAAAKKAGADVAAGEEFLQQLDKGTIDFDVLVATPTVMAKLGKYARVLGPKGLMPNPKSGTVTKDVAKAVEQAKAGKVELRVDETGIIHLGIGKVSFGSDKLLSNAQAVLTAVKSAKPSTIKGNYVVSMFATTTMGPSIRISSSEL